MPSSRKKQRIRLKSALECRAKDYSLAAVGIGAVAFASPASAAITVVPINHNLIVGARPYTISVNGNNVGSIFDTSSGPMGAFSVGVSSGTFWAPASVGVLNKSNQTLETIPPVNLGQPIPGAFPTHKLGNLAFSTTSLQVQDFKGIHYLGFSFGSGANIHYGWVQLNISQPGGAHKPFSVTVVEAAYETTAGQPIAAGATTDTPAGPAPTPAPNSLWLLALGAAGLGGLEWMRRRRTA